jgi:protein SCO1/2
VNTIKSIATLVASLMFMPVAVGAHEGASAAEIGIDEKLGQFVPLGLSFTDENGGPVTLREIVQTPTLVGLQYYTCRNACGVLAGAMASVLGQLDAVPGQDYGVLSISINPQETPADAREAKRIALESIGRSYPPETWKFLTGDESAIDRFTDAVGFRFVRNGDEFDHPLALVMLSPQGKIVRYMYGDSYLPVDLKMAILEASSGTIGPTIGKVLRFCFRYDPRSNQYVFNVLKVTAVVTLTLAAVFVLFLFISGGKRAAGGRTDGKLHD